MWYLLRDLNPPPPCLLYNIESLFVTWKYVNCICDIVFIVDSNSELIPGVCKVINSGSYDIKAYIEDFRVIVTYI